MNTLTSRAGAYFVLVMGPFWVGATKKSRGCSPGPARVPDGRERGGRRREGEAVKGRPSAVGGAPPTHAGPGARRPVAAPTLPGRRCPRATKFLFGAGRAV